MTLTLLYLQAPLLDDRLFLRDFFSGVGALPGPTLVLHEPPAGAVSEATTDRRRIAMTGKRLSANLSEAMVPNIAMTGAQRGLLTRSGEGLVLHRERLAEVYAQVTTVVLSPLVAEAGADGLGSYTRADEVLVALRRQWSEAVRVVLFADNPLSPLGATPAPVAGAEAAAALRGLYPEESAALARAEAWAPVVMATPKSLADLGTP